jgi:uncharacterized NAD(P)/FAD-binding protein YdhS
LTYDVAIVGAGFSAIALTINLLDILPSEATIAVIGDDPGFGRGTAYRTEFYLHRLNVPAARMSIFPDQPDDFTDWLTSRGKAVSPDTFASRGDFGLYLRDRLASRLRAREHRARLDFVRAKAVSCNDGQGDGISFVLDTGGSLRARTVVLALGVGSAGLPVASDRVSAAARGRIIENPWTMGWLSHVGRNDEICVLGSGLTMIDQVLSLRARGHRGPIRALSRRGLVPMPHLDRRSEPVAVDLPDGAELSQVLHALRRSADDVADWRSVIDGLRPKTQALWQGLTMAQRSRFMRHALAWWNIHRHRIAPDVHREFQALVADGTVKVEAGFLSAIHDDGDGVRVEYRPRGSQNATTFIADLVVNCTGMEKAGIRHSPLLRTMCDLGLIRIDELSLGIVVDKTSRVLGDTQRTNAALFAVGALTAGQFWEITAVPDIRVQAIRIAEAISAELHVAKGRATRRA